MTDREYIPEWQARGDGGSTAPTRELSPEELRLLEELVAGGFHAQNDCAFNDALVAFIMGKLRDVAERAWAAGVLSEVDRNPGDPLISAILPTDFPLLPPETRAKALEEAGDWEVHIPDSEGE